MKSQDKRPLIGSIIVLSAVVLIVLLRMGCSQSEGGSQGTSEAFSTEELMAMRIHLSQVSLKFKDGSIPPSLVTKAYGLGKDERPSADGFRQALGKEYQLESFEVLSEADEPFPTAGEFHTQIMPLKSPHALGDRTVGGKIALKLGKNKSGEQVLELLASQLLVKDGKQFDGKVPGSVGLRPNLYKVCGGGDRLRDGSTAVFVLSIYRVEQPK